LYQRNLDYLKQRLSEGQYLKFDSMIEKLDRDYFQMKGFGRRMEIP
jgi:hypothetical protein